MAKKKQKTCRRHSLNILAGLKRRGANPRQVRSASSLLCMAEHPEKSHSETCSYCHVRYSYDRASLDHRDPVSMGGGHQKSNLQVICKRCNGAKSNLYDHMFRNLVALLFDWDRTYDGTGGYMNGILSRLAAGNMMYRRYGR